MLRREFRTRDSVLRSTQKLGVSDLHHMEKVMHGGGRQNTVYFCTLREKERKSERELHPTGAHLDESVHSSSISPLINCESHTYIAHTWLPHLPPIFGNENERDGKILSRTRARNLRASFDKRLKYIYSFTEVISVCLIIETR